MIGVYEPLVMLRSEEVRHTSLAAEPDMARDPGAIYLHRACHLQALEPDPDPD